MSWITITVDNLKEAKIAKLIDSLSQRAKANNQPDRGPAIIQSVVKDICRKIASNPQNRVDADPTKIPESLKNMAVDMAIARLKIALEQTLSDDERTQLRDHKQDLNRIADGRDPIEQPDDPIEPEVQSKGGMQHFVGGAGDTIQSMSGL